MSNFPLSDAALELFKNFANINPQVKFDVGVSQRVCNTSRNFIADVDLPDPIPVECALFDLNRLLGIIDTCKSATLPDLVFGEQNLTITHEHGKVTLPYAHMAVIVEPPNHKFILAKQFATFDLPNALWIKIKRTASVLQTTTIQFTIDAAGTLAVKLVNDKDKGGESIGWGSYNMPNTVVEPGVPAATWAFKFDALELLPGDYTVAIGDVTGVGDQTGKSTTIFGAFFTLNDPTKRVVYLTSGHVVKSR